MIVVAVCLPVWAFLGIVWGAAIGGFVLAAIITGGTR